MTNLAGLSEEVLKTHWARPAQPQTAQVAKTIICRRFKLAGLVEFNYLYHWFDSTKCFVITPKRACNYRVITKKAKQILQQFSAGDIDGSQHQKVH